MTWLVGFMLVSIGVCVGFLLCAVITTSKIDELYNEIIALENENDALRGVS